MHFPPTTYSSSHSTLKTAKYLYQLYHLFCTSKVQLFSVMLNFLIGRPVGMLVDGRLGHSIENKVLVVYVVTPGLIVMANVT